GEGIMQNLQRDLAVQLRVPAPVDLAHAARPNRSRDFIRAKTSAGGKRHKSRPILATDLLTEKEKPFSFERRIAQMNGVFPVGGTRYRSRARLLDSSANR